MKAFKIQEYASNVRNRQYRNSNRYTYAWSLRMSTIYIAIYDVVREKAIWIVGNLANHRCPKQLLKPSIKTRHTRIGHDDGEVSVRFKMVPAPPSQGVQDIDGAIEEMWTESTTQIAQIDPASENWKAQVLPLARIKKIMKSEEAVYVELERERLQQQNQQSASNGANSNQNNSAPNTRFMIAGEAPILLGKACELLIKELTVRAWRHTERNRRRTLQRQDVHAAVGESEVYDFLIDIVPRITTTAAAPSSQKAAGGSFSPSVAATATVVTAPETLAMQAQQQQQQQQQPPPPGGALPYGGTLGPAPTAPPAQAPGGDMGGIHDAEARYAHLQQVQEQMQEHYMMMQHHRMGAPPAQGANLAGPPGTGAPPGSVNPNGEAGAPPPHGQVGQPAPPGQMPITQQHQQQQQQHQQAAMMLNHPTAQAGVDPHSMYGGAPIGAGGQAPQHWGAQPPASGAMPPASGL